MIAIADLVKSHGPHRVLDGVSMTIAQGEVAAVIGPSGGGKSTLLRCINGLEQFEAGRIQVDDLTLGPGAAAPELLRKLRGRVGMVFQQFNLFPHMTALQNVMAGPLHARGRAREEAEPAARTLLERVGLGAKLASRPDQLSGGQQQRVAIARALAVEPEVILFDEPTSALDPAMAAEVMGVITDLARSGQTMVVVTHSMEFARSAARTVHVMAAARIVESGPAAEVMENPAQEVTRTFLRQAGKP